MFLFLFAVGGILVGVGDGIRGELAGNFRDQEEQRNIRGAGVGSCMNWHGMGDGEGRWRHKERRIGDCRGEEKRSGQ